MNDDRQLALNRLAEILFITFQKERPMKKFVLVAVMASSLISGQAIAACDKKTELGANALKALLGGNTVCVPKVTVATMTWQELHVGTSTSTTGDLVDYKRGPPPRPDPTAKVGTWTVTGSGNGNATVIHNYGSGGTYTYTVHPIGGAFYEFCNGATVIEARVQSGSGAC